MLSSGQVSQMFAQQNQQFAGNAMYSQQISQQMPGMYSSGYGSSQGFQYGGQTPMGYDVGSRVSGGIMSGMGGAAQFGLGAGALMAGMGMGGPMRYALDPFAGAGAMYRAGGAMGMGMGGRLAMGAVGMLPAAGVLAGAGHVIGSVMSGAQQQAGIERVLGQNFNFSNSSSGGRGFSRQQGQAIGDMVRQLEHMPEMMTSVGELTRIMDKMGQMGVMNGVTNVREFGTKFKGTLNVLREMSKVIGTTMEDALPLFGEIRRSGMYTNSDIMKNAMQRQVVGGLTGMNQTQVAQTAAYGAQLGFATGGSRATGSQHALRMAGQLGMANQMGILSNDQVLELTGQEGAAGIQALSGQLTQAGYRMSGSALGTAMSIAMAEQKGGKFTGKMDAGLMEQFRSGSISKADMLRMVHQKTGSRGSKMSYVTHKGQLRSEMAGQMGVEGQMNMLQMVLGERGYDNPDALNIVSQGFGLDEREAGLLVDLGKKMPDLNIEMKQRGRSEAKRVAQEAFMKQNYSWDAVKSKVGKRIEHVITEPFKQFGADLRTSITQAVDDFVDDITGKYKVEVTQGMSNLMRGAGSNLGDARKRLAGMLGGGTGKLTGGALNKGVDMGPGLMGSAMNWLTGSQTSGERMADVMRDTSVGRDALVMAGDSQGKLEGQGYNTLATQHHLFGTNVNTMATSADMFRTSQYLTAMSQGGISKMSALQGTAGLRGATADFSYQLATGGGRGAAFEQLAGQLGGGNDALGAIGFRTRGELAGSSLEARRQLAEKAGLLSSLPDRGQDIAKNLKSSERRIARMFGGEGSEEIMGTIKAMQGTQGGDTLARAFLQRRTRGDTIADNFTSVTALDRQLHGTLDSGDRHVRNTASGIKAAISAGDVDMTVDGAGDHFDTEQFFQKLARTELSGKKLSAGSKSAISENKETYEAIKEQVRIGELVLMSKNGSNSFTPDQKAQLQKMGYKDPKDFTPAEAEKWGKFGELMNKAKLNDSDRRALKDYTEQLGASGTIEIAQRIAAQGRDVEGRARALRKSGVVKGKEGESMLSRIEGYSGKMSGMTSIGGVQSGMGLTGGTSYAEDMGSIAYDLTNMKDQKLARTLSGADDNLGAAYDQAISTKRKLSKNRGFDSFFDVEGAIRKGDTATAEQLGSVRKQFFDDKGSLKKGMDADFIKFQASERGQQLMTAAGAEQRSKYASQADIAKNMESFGQSVASLAQIVQTMKDGKTAGGKAP